MKQLEEFKNQFEKMYETDLFCEDEIDGFKDIKIQTSNRYDFIEQIKPISTCIKKCYCKKQIDRSKRLLLVFYFEGFIGLSISQLYINNMNSNRNINTDEFYKAFHIKRQLRIVLKYLQRWFYIVMIVDTNYSKLLLKNLIKYSFQFDLIYVVDQKKNKNCMINLNPILYDLK